MSDSDDDVPLARRAPAVKKEVTVKAGQPLQVTVVQSTNVLLIQCTTAMFPSHAPLPACLARTPCKCFDP